jgi:hypothetical protein
MAVVYSKNSKSDSEPCPSFFDVAHLQSHISFFSDCWNFSTKLRIEGAKSRFHRIKTKESGERVCQLTSMGQSILDAQVCGDTTAFGRLQIPGALEGMEVERIVPDHTDITEPEVKLLVCPMYQATRRQHATIC